LILWAKRASAGWLFSIYAQPGAKRTEVSGLHGDALKVRVAAPPAEGRANEELVAFLAAALGVPKKSVAVVQGTRSRRKTVSVAAHQVDPASLLLRCKSPASGD
jgi:uncharacterized protein (TIGR00251 family)